ncbi:TPA: shufflon system plasmid conjugative transfer pilus tip adhesin PilV [Burkholderia orbicola]|nr:shufflon system plasmid conjugative transfer pilus tip adhesin PilV [Burkholderia cenocepacia]
MGEMLGSLAATLMWLMMASGLFVWLQHAADAIQVAGAANQAQVMGAALGRYVKDHGAELAAVATSAKPAKVTVSDLQAGGYLPSGMSPANVFRQQWVAQVLQPQPGKLQTMLFTTGGVAIPPRKLVPLASQSSGRGNLGGFVPYPNQAGDASMQPSVAMGAGGTFRQSLAGYANPGSGHLAMMVGVADAPSDNGFLYRIDMKPGRPELNAMQTDLSMTGTDSTAHNISGANVITAQSLNALAGGSLATPSLKTANGTVITWNQVPDGGVLSLQGANGQWVHAESRNGTFRLVDSAWHKSTFSVDQEGNVVAANTLRAGNIATPGANCEPNGIMAGNSDGSGQMLSCQYGKWMPIGGRWLRYGYYTVMDGTWVPQPTCPNGGSMQIQVTPQNIKVDDTSVVNAGPATWTGNGWQVHLTDGKGAGISGAQAIAATYCAY